MDIDNKKRMEQIPEDRITIVQRMIVLDEALEKIEGLTARQQIVVISRFLGLKTFEICELLGIDTHKAGRPKKKP